MKIFFFIFTHYVKIKEVLDVINVVINFISDHHGMALLTAENRYL